MYYLKYRCSQCDDRALANYLKGLISEIESGNYAFRPWKRGINGTIESQQSMDADTTSSSYTNDDSMDVDSKSAKS